MGNIRYIGNIGKMGNLHGIGNIGTMGNIDKIGNIRGIVKIGKIRGIDKYTNGGPNYNIMPCQKRIKWPNNLFFYFR